MKLYQRKNNIENIPNRRGRERYIKEENNPKKNVYLQKMVKYNIVQTQNEVIDFSNNGVKLNNIRSNMENIFSNEEKKKKQSNMY